MSFALAMLTRARQMECQIVRFTLLIPSIDCEAVAVVGGVYQAAAAVPRPAARALQSSVAACAKRGKYSDRSQGRAGSRDRHTAVNSEAAPHHLRRVHRQGGRALSEAPVCRLRPQA